MNRQLQVLVVDDDAALCELYAELLSSDGHAVRTASDGIEALALLDAQVDLVVTDLNMPRMSGDGFIRELRQRPSFKDLPVLVITAFPSQLPEALKGPWTSVLRKPFRLDAFTSYVEAVARRARQH